MSKKSLGEKIKNTLDDANIKDYEAIGVLEFIKHQILNNCKGKKDE